MNSDTRTDWRVKRRMGGNATSKMTQRSLFEFLPMRCTTTASTYAKAKHKQWQEMEDITGHKLMGGLPDRKGETEREVERCHRRLRKPKEASNRKTRKER